MSTLRKRLDDIAERKAFREFIEARRQFRGRSDDELEFFSIHGYFPEGAGELPDRTGVYRWRNLHHYHHRREDISMKPADFRGRK